MFLQTICLTHYIYITLCYTSGNMWKLLLAVCPHSLVTLFLTVLDNDWSSANHPDSGEPLVPESQRTHKATTTNLFLSRILSQQTRGQSDMQHRNLSALEVRLYF